MTTLTEINKRLSEIINPQTMRHSKWLWALGEEKVLDFNIRKRLQIISTLLHYRPEINAPADFRFEVGKTYPTMGGDLITIVQQADDIKGYECVVGNDDIARYNRSGAEGCADLGRVTGADGDDPRNLIPLALNVPPKPKVGKDIGEFTRLKNACLEEPGLPDQPQTGNSPMPFYPSPRNFSKPLRGWRIREGHVAGNMRHKAGPIQIHADDGGSLLVSRYGLHESMQKFWISADWVYSEVTGRW